MQKSIKKIDLSNFSLKATLMAELSVKNAEASALKSRLKALRYRVAIAKFLSRPSAWNGPLNRTNQFLLDLCLPPDRAEETSIALQDVCESKWEKSYGPRTRALLCFAHSISAIWAHHRAGRIFKFGGLLWFIAELKKAFSKFWGD